MSVRDIVVATPVLFLVALSVATASAQADPRREAAAPVNLCGRSFPGTPVPGSGTWLVDDVQGRTCLRPRTFSWDGGYSYNSFRIVEIRWSSWGGAEALGSGYSVGIAMGISYRTRTTLRAYAVQRRTECGAHVRFYRRLQVTTRFGAQTVAPPPQYCGD